MYSEKKCLPFVSINLFHKCFLLHVEYIFGNISRKIIRIYNKNNTQCKSEFMTYITKQGIIYESERFLTMNSNYNEEIQDICRKNFLSSSY